MRIQTGQSLILPSLPPKGRHQLNTLMEYLHSKAPETDRVCALYGLRHTGKTILLWQGISCLLEEKVPPGEILFLTCGNGDSMREVLKVLEEFSGRYIFIDGAFSLQGFVKGAAPLYNDFSSARGRRVVLSGANQTALYVAIKETLFDDVILLPVSHLTFYEHCHFVNPTDSPCMSHLTTYLEEGGLFAPMSVQAYMESAIIHPIRELLRTEDPRCIRRWFSRECYKKLGWRGVLDNICLQTGYRSDNEHTLYWGTYQTDAAHLQQELNFQFNGDLLHECSLYFIADKLGRSVMPKTEAKALLEFLSSCGFLLELPNIAHHPVDGQKPRIYVTFPFIRYAYTTHLIGAFGLKGETQKQALLKNQLVSCAMSEYRLAYPKARLHYWKEPFFLRDTFGNSLLDVNGSAQTFTAKCDLVDTRYNRRSRRAKPPSGGKAYAFFPEFHDPSEDFSYLQQEHPEYGIETYDNLSGEHAAQFIYALGMLAYDKKEAQRLLDSIRCTL